MNNPGHATVPATPSIPPEVLQSDHHTRFTIAEIAKAVDRHKREHPTEVISGKPQKTMPRR
jgi:hypothetical protein